MVTNFEHLSNNKGLYDKMIFIENRLCDGNSKEDYIQALSAMRGVLDIMMAEWVKKAGLSDANVLMYMTQKFGNSQTTVNLYGRIYALEKSGAISRETANLLHDIRREGNDAAHQDSDLITLSKEQMFRRAVSVYEKLYRTTYEFSLYENKAKANSYEGSTFGASSVFGVINKRAQVSDLLRKGILPKGNGIWDIIGLIIGALLILFFYIMFVEGELDGAVAAIIFPFFSIFWQFNLVTTIVGRVKAKNSGEAISKQMTEPEMDAFLSMTKAEQRTFASIKNTKLRNPKRYTAAMDWQCNHLLGSHMGSGVNIATTNLNQYQFMNLDQQQQFTNQTNDNLNGLHQFMDQHQEFMNQQHQFMNQMNLDQQQQFMDQQQQFMDHATAFNDPLNSTEGPSIFNGGMDSGLNLGGMDFGNGFGDGFGNGF